MLQSYVSQTGSVGASNISALGILYSFNKSSSEDNEESIFSKAICVFNLSLSFWYSTYVFVVLITSACVVEVFPQVIELRNSPI